MKKELTEEDFKKWGEEQIRFYAPILGIQLQNIRFVKSNKDIYMEIDNTYPYLDPDIRFGQKIFDLWAQGEVKRDRILHELIHIITDPLFNKATSRFVSENEIRHEREKLTDTFAMIIRNLTEK